MNHCELLFFKKDLFIILCECLSVYMSVNHVSTEARRGYEIYGTELQIVMSHNVGAGIEPGSPAKAIRTLTANSFL